MRGRRLEKTKSQNPTGPDNGDGAIDAALMAPQKNRILREARDGAGAESDDQ
jgi:hypothetical protein